MSVRSEKFQNAQIHRSVEAKSSFIGADGGVELHAIADVHLHFAFIIDPRHTESDDALGFYQAFEQRSALPFGVLIVDVSDAEEHLVNGLEVLFLAGVASFELLHESSMFMAVVVFGVGVCVASWLGFGKETGARSDANGRLDYLIISQPCRVAELWECGCLRAFGNSRGARPQCAARRAPIR